MKHPIDVLIFARYGLGLALVTDLPPIERIKLKMI
jgi:hypothetical protein